MYGLAVLINERFIYKIDEKKIVVFLPVLIVTAQIIDVVINEPVAKLIRLGTGRVNNIRIWLNLKTCGPNYGGILDVEKTYKKLIGENNEH